MKPQTISKHDRAVSPVIGVILMVAITVILAAVIGTFVLDLGQSAGQTSPSASFQVSEDGGDLTITHRSGDVIDLEDTEIIIRDSNGEPGRFTYDSNSYENSSTAPNSTIDATSLNGEMGAGDQLETEIDGGLAEGEVEVSIIDTESSNTIFTTTIRA